MSKETGCQTNGSRLFFYPNTLRRERILCVPCLYRVVRFGKSLRRERIVCVPRQCLRDNSARHNGEKSYIRSFGTHTMRSLHFCFCSQICLQMYLVHIFGVELHVFHACTGLCDSASRCRRERIVCVPRQCLSHPIRLPFCSLAPAKSVTV